jgi:hypothetical protein
MKMEGFHRPMGASIEFVESSHCFGGAEFLTDSILTLSPSHILLDFNASRRELHQHGQPPTR